MEQPYEPDLMGGTCILALTIQQVGTKNLECVVVASIFIHSERFIGHIAALSPLQRACSLLFDLIFISSLPCWPHQLAGLSNCSLLSSLVSSLVAMQCTLVASLSLFAFLPAGGSLSYWLGVILILVVILLSVLFVGRRRSPGSVR